MAFSLTPKQTEANRLLGSAASNIMLRGGSRSGKTFLLVRAIVQRGLNAPRSKHAIWRYRFNHAKASIWNDTLPKVLATCFPTLAVGRNETELIATLPNDSEIILGGLDDKARVEKVLGQEYATLYFNESSQIPWSSVETAMSRLAQSVTLDPAIARATGRTHLPLKAYFDCNPPSKLHWSYELFRTGVKPGTKEKLADPSDYVEMLMNPADNSANLPAKYFDILANMSEAKRLRFERGEWASEVAGALWTLEGIDLHRVSVIPALQRIVVAVDPSGTKGEGKGDDIGILVVGLGFDGRAYVLEDLTCQMSPDGWGRRAVEAYHRWQADCIVAEGNFGGAMVEHVIRTADKLVAFKMVTASRGKAVRAEPVSALYEQGLVSHVGSHPDLEDQMANMTAAGYVGEGSPDRADALVWAITELKLAAETVVAMHLSKRRRPGGN
jgi:predicted phage terminase large subunit-like protein